MKKSFLVLCSIFFVFISQQADAQAADELANLFGRARIQFLNQQVEAQDFSLQILGGESADLSSYKGKVVLLNFWATWCPPCRQEMPSMETLYQRYKNNGLEMLAVNLRENSNVVRQFIQRNSYTFPVMLDTNGRVGAMYGIEAIPTTFILDKEGNIIGRLVGSIYWDTPQVFALFDALLK